MADQNFFERKKYQTIVARVLYDYKKTYKLPPADLMLKGYEIQKKSGRLFESKEKFFANANDVAGFITSHKDSYYRQYFYNRKPGRFYCEHNYVDFMNLMMGNRMMKLKNDREVEVVGLPLMEVDCMEDFMPRANNLIFDIYYDVYQPKVDPEGEDDGTLTEKKAFNYYRKYLREEKDPEIKAAMDQMRLFGLCQHSIGNFCVMPKGFPATRSRSKSLRNEWDLSLRFLLDNPVDELGNPVPDFDATDVSSYKKKTSDIEPFLKELENDRFLFMSEWYQNGKAIPLYEGHDYFPAERTWKEQADDLEEINHRIITRGLELRSRFTGPKEKLEAERARELLDDEDLMWEVVMEVAQVL